MMLHRSRSPRRRRPSSWRRWVGFAIGLLILLLAPLLAYAQGTDDVTLSWSAPGDDNNIGTAQFYDMRYAIAPITLGNWNAANSVPGMPAPLIAGSRQTVLVNALSTDTTYYFAIRTRDDAGNWSALSNVVRWDWVIDAAPPAAPANVRGTHSDPSVTVQWNANSEPDLQGYSVYRSGAVSGTFTRLNGTLLTGLSYVDNAIPGGASTLFYRVSATDQSGNESALSAIIQVNLGTTGNGEVADWSMSPGYPNPSRSGEAVCVPVVIPSGGAGDASIEVVDSGGHRVRRFSVASASTCAEGVLWDGRNDAGREVAPGIYRAWLIASERRDYIKLVRQP